MLCTSEESVPQTGPASTCLRGPAACSTQPFPVLLGHTGAKHPQNLWSARSFSASTAHIPPGDA